MANNNPHTPVAVDKNEQDRAVRTWGAFTQLMQYSVIGIVVFLIILAAILYPAIP